MGEGTREPWSRIYVCTQPRWISAGPNGEYGGGNDVYVLCVIAAPSLLDERSVRLHYRRVAAPASTSIMFLSAWLTSKPTDRAGGSDGRGTGDAAAATADVRANRIRSRAGGQDDGSALRHTKRRRKGDVVAPGSGLGSGSGSGGKSAAQPRVKISIPKAGGYDKLQLVEFGSGATSGPNLTTEDEDSLVVVSTSFVGINYADICVRYVTCRTRFHTYLT